MMLDSFPVAELFLSTVELLCKKLTLIYNRKSGHVIMTNTILITYEVKLFSRAIIAVNWYGLARPFFFSTQNDD